MISIQNKNEVMNLRHLTTCLIQNPEIDYHDIEKNQLNFLEQEIEKIYCTPLGTLSSSKVNEFGSQYMNDVISCVLISPEEDFFVTFYNFTNRFLVFF